MCMRKIPRNCSRQYQKQDPGEFSTSGEKTKEVNWSNKNCEKSCHFLSGATAEATDSRGGQSPLPPHPRQPVQVPQELGRDSSITGKIVIMSS